MKAPKAIVECDGINEELNVIALHFYEDSGNLCGIDVLYFGNSLQLDISHDGTFKNGHGNMTAKLIKE